LSTHGGLLGRAARRERRRWPGSGGRIRQGLLELSERYLHVVNARFAATEETVHAVAGVAGAERVDEADGREGGAADCGEPDPGVAFLFFCL
jgi:hypothetical protein